MIRANRCVVLLAMFSLFTSPGLAFAECAWVRWNDEARVDARQVAAIVAGSDGLLDSKSELAGFDHRSKLASEFLSNLRRPQKRTASR